MIHFCLAFVIVPRGTIHELINDHVDGSLFQTKRLMMTIHKYTPPWHKPRPIYVQVHIHKHLFHPWFTAEPLITVPSPGRGNFVGASGTLTSSNSSWETARIVKASWLKVSIPFTKMQLFVTHKLLLQMQRCQRLLWHSSQGMVFELGWGKLIVCSSCRNRTIAECCSNF